MAKLHKTCLVLGAVLLSLVLGACRNTPPQQSSSSQPAPQAAPAPAPAPVQPAPASSTAASSAASSPAVEGEYPGLRVAIQELKRTSTTLTLKIMIINDTDNSFGFGYRFTDGSAVDHGSIAAVHLIDAAAKKKYFVVRDSEGVPLCSRSAPDIAAKSRSLLWIKFPAPPDDVQKITVEIPHFPPVEDVPITR